MLPSGPKTTFPAFAAYYDALVTDSQTNANPWNARTHPLHGSHRNDPPPNLNFPPLPPPHLGHHTTNPFIAHSNLQGGHFGRQEPFANHGVEWRRVAAVQLASSSVEQPEIDKAASCGCSSSGRSSNSSCYTSQGGGGNVTKLFVGNLASDTTLDELFELFAPYGELNRQRCVIKDNSYAFIHFFSAEAAKRAHDAVNGLFFHNRYIRVQYSVSHLRSRKLSTVNSSFNNQSQSKLLFFVVV